LKKVDWYVLKEMLIPLIAGTVVIALLFGANELIAIFKQLDLNSVPRAAVLKYAILTLPKWFALTLPMGVTFGSSLAISRLTREGEMTALRAAGYSIWRVLRVTFLCGLAFAGLSFYNSKTVTPWADRQSTKLMMEFGILAAVPKFERNTTLNLPPYSANIGEVQQEGQDLILRDILLYERPKPGQVYFYSAKEGRYSAGVWTIKNPDIRVIEGESLIMINRVKELVINQRIVIEDVVAGALPRNIPTDELWRNIQDIKRAGGQPRTLEVEFYARYASAATCVAFSLLGGILAVRFRRGSAFQGFLISLITVWLYFNAAIIATEVIGKNGWLVPMQAAWLPVALIGVVIALASWRLE
jgi:lipopolysaccharide export system permease protein